jgi:hypothetical protein
LRVVDLFVQGIKSFSGRRVIVRRGQRHDRASHVAVGFALSQRRIRAGRPRGTSTGSSMKRGSISSAKALLVQLLAMTARDTNW